MSQRFKVLMIATATATALLPASASAGAAKGNLVAAAMQSQDHQTLVAAVKPANRDQLKAVLTYHVVAGKVGSAQLVEAIRTGGGQAMLKTVQGGTLTARLSGGSVVLTDAAGGTATVTKADLVQSNGIIHVTDAVSLPM